MPRYQVKPGEVLPHDGTVRQAGAIVELPRVVAEDPTIRGVLQEVDAAGAVVTAPVADVLREIERFKPHEQVTLLERAVAEAEERVAALKAQLDTARAAATPPAPVVVPVAADSPAAPQKPSADAPARAGKEK